jgi:hypothetical protein
MADHQRTGQSLKNLWLGIEQAGALLTAPIV